MNTIDVNYINPLLKASLMVIKQACNLDITLGRPSLREASFTDNEMLVLMGITGEMKGQAILDFPVSTCLKIASQMCMMEMTELNDISQSAVCELCNMIMGNTATLFSQQSTLIDITPPTVCMGNVKFSNSFAANICIPVNFEGAHFFDINIAIKEN